MVVKLEERYLDFFQKDLAELNIVLDEKQFNQFIVYYELLREWNEVMNLTAITDFDEVCKKHFIDSLSLVKAYDMNIRTSVIDVGTGAGFPGIPLKIAFPDLKITLLDSLKKRIGFLQNVIEKLQLDGMEVYHGRAEDYAKKKNFREQYDLCVSRAVANLSTLSEYCIPYVKTGGYFISYKSEKLTEEIKAAEKAIYLLGGRMEKQVEFQIPNSDIYRNLLVIYKEKETPAVYPRKAGIPSKKPIY
ncbi:MAG: 16S rRNA (guanine(527)-N(7))-methyltransferase RsmG [Blautia sp.]|nr:16S rRNA (guanine(527)-N(7))-methyltransferase RsmG [Blautia sp.]MCM1199839.1 16S rRNA (guanine(527)-N(7))-methyltransferase RsmG [Bacteroides fragilis]